MICQTARSAGRMQPPSPSVYAVSPREEPPMAEEVTQAARAVPRALAEPSERVRAGWIGGLGLASLGMWMANQTPANFLIPRQIGAIDPRGKLFGLGLIFAIAAVASVLATPIAGAISDRTSHARAIGHLRGRRHRWTLV